MQFDMTSNINLSHVMKYKDNFVFKEGLTEILKFLVLIFYWIKHFPVSSIC